MGNVFSWFDSCFVLEKLREYIIFLLLLKALNDRLLSLGNRIPWNTWSPCVRMCKLSLYEPVLHSLHTDDFKIGGIWHNPGGCSLESCVWILSGWTLVGVSSLSDPKQFSVIFEKGWFVYSYVCDNSKNGIKLHAIVTPGRKDIRHRHLSLHSSHQPGILVWGLICGQMPLKWCSFEMVKLWNGVVCTSQPKTDV